MRFGRIADPTQLDFPPRQCYTQTHILRVRIADWGEGDPLGTVSFRHNIHNRNRVTGLPDLGGPASWCLVQSVRVEPTGFLIECLETLLTAHFA